MFDDPHPGEVTESCCDQDVPKVHLCASMYMCECVHAHVFAHVSARVSFHAHVYAVHHMQCILHA